MPFSKKYQIHNVILGTIVDNIFFALVMSMSTMSIWYNGMADKNDYTGEGKVKFIKNLKEMTCMDWEGIRFYCLSKNSYTIELAKH